jgi:ribosomal protein S18 acetylase RimI-like enzyme
MNADRLEAAFWAAFLRNRNVEATTAGDGAVAVAGGYALCVMGTYHQVALAVGSTRALREDDLAVLEAFYGRRDRPVRLEVREDVLERDRELFQAAGYDVADAGLALLETTNVPDEPRSQITVRSTGDRAAWVRLVTRAFGEGHPPGDEHRRSAEISAAAASRLFVADIDGVAAGAGAVGISADVAYLYSAAVLPQFRRRGVHRALLHARVAFGAAQGAARSASKTVEGTDAEHSALNAGFTRTATLRRLAKLSP